MKDYGLLIFAVLFLIFGQLVSVVISLHQIDSHLTTICRNQPEPEYVC